MSDEIKNALRLARAFGGDAYAANNVAYGMRRGGEVSRRGYQVGGMPIGQMPDQTMNNQFGNPMNSFGQQTQNGVNGDPIRDMGYASPPPFATLDNTLPPPQPVQAPVPSSYNPLVSNTPPAPMADGGVAKALRLTRGLHAIPLHQAIARHGYATDGEVTGDVQFADQQPEQQQLQAPAQQPQDDSVFQREMAELPTADGTNAQQLDVGRYQSSYKPEQMYEILGRGDKLTDQIAAEEWYKRHPSEQRPTEHQFDEQKSIAGIDQPLDVESRIERHIPKGTATVVDPEGRQGNPLFVAGTTPSGENSKLNFGQQSALAAHLGHLYFYSDPNTKEAAITTFQPKQKLPFGLSNNAVGFNLSKDTPENSLAHEFGHNVHNYLGRADDPLRGASDEAHNEFDQMSEDRWKSYYHSAKDMRPYAYMPQEQWAEGMKMYLNNPSTFKALYPNAAKFMRGIINTDPRINRLLMLSKLEGTQHAANGGAVDDALKLAHHTLSNRRAYATDGAVPDENFEGDVQFAPEEAQQAQAPLPLMAQDPTQQHLEQAFSFEGRPQKDPSQFVQQELNTAEPQVKQYNPEAGMLTAKEAGLMAAGMAPGAGIASAAGQFPTAEGGKEPSLREDWNAGNYGSALLKALGAAGDVAYGVPLAGPALGSAMKAPLAVKLATAIPAAARATGEVTRTAEPVADALQLANQAKAYQRLTNPLGFYSHGHEVANTLLPEGPRTWQEMQALLNKYNVKKEELKWAGLNPEAYDPAYKITREDIANRFEQNFPQTDITWKEKGSDMEPKWEQYTAPGGSNYAESILHLPYTREGAEAIHPQIQNKYNAELAQLRSDALDAEIEARVARNRSGEIGNEYKKNNEEKFKQLLRSQGESEGSINNRFQDIYPIHLAHALGEEKQYADLFKTTQEVVAEAEKRSGVANVKADALLKRMRQESAPLHPEYTRGHFSHQSHLDDIDNPLLHQRWKERVGPNGEKILSNEEFQSDWGQQGREQGFKNPEAEAEHKKLNAQETEVANARRERQLEDIGRYQKERAPVDDSRDRALEDLKSEYSVKLDPEERRALEEIRDRISSGQTISNQKERKLFQYLSNKDFDQDLKNINLDNAIHNKFNSDTHDIIEASVKKLDNIRSNPNLSDMERNRLIQEEENRFSQEMAPYEAARDKAYADNEQRMAEYRSRLQQVHDEHASQLSPIEEAHNKRLEEIKASYEPYFDEIQQQRDKLPKAGQIPLAPHIGSTDQWTELGVKHALQHALESGHDSIFIMGGQEQARRYQNGLRQAVDNIRWEQPGTVEYPTLSSVMGEPAITDTSFRTVYAKPKSGGQEHKFIVDKDGRVIDSNMPAAKGEKISAVIGSDLAKQVMQEESGNVPMKNYIMNAEGYTQHYERKVPSAYKKIIKQILGVEPKVEAGRLHEKGGAPRTPTDTDIDTMVENMSRSEIDELSQQAFGRSYDDLSPDEHDELSEIAHEAMFNRWHKQNKNKSTEGPHGTYIHITPEMREAYNRLKEQKGAVFPNYAEGGEVKEYKTTPLQKKALRLANM
jgi:hypothetical protein